MNENKLFLTDAGELPLDTRRVLVNLLTGPVLSGLRSTKLWSVLLRDERLIRSRLNELFLELVLDDDLKVAFVRQADAPDVDAPSLLRKTTLSFKESVLVLHLRQQLAAADTKGERCIIDRETMLSHMELYNPANATDTVKLQKQAEAAIEKMVKLNVLDKLKGNENTYEVSPVLKLVFTPEDIKELTKAYELLRNPDAAADSVESQATSATATPVVDERTDTDVEVEI